MPQQPFQLQAIQPVKTFIITYTDAGGIPRQTICSEIDGTLYAHPNSESWCRENVALPIEVQKQYKELVRKALEGK